MPEKRNTPPEATGSPRSEDSAGRAFIFPRPENVPFLGYLPGPARARSHQSAGAGPGGPLLQLLPFGPAAPDPRARDAQQRTRAQLLPGIRARQLPRILATGPRRILHRRPPGRPRCTKLTKLTERKQAFAVMHADRLTL